MGHCGGQCPARVRSIDCSDRPMRYRTRIDSRNQGHSLSTTTLVLGMAVALSACGADTGTPSRSANQPGPASAQLQLAGTDGLTGSVTATYTRCFVPTLEGLSITIVGHPAG